MTGRARLLIPAVMVAYRRDLVRLARISRFGDNVYVQWRLPRHRTGLAPRRRRP